MQTLRTTAPGGIEERAPVASEVAERSPLEPWRGFDGSTWRSAIDVVAFIRANYTPYEGDESFLAGATNRTHHLWAMLQPRLVEERQRGIYDVDVHTPSAITSHVPGYIDREREIIVGLQTDEPLKRAIMTNGGLRLVEHGLAAYGYELDPGVRDVFTTYRKTHNDGVLRRLHAGYPRRPPVGCDHRCRTPTGAVGSSVTTGACPCTGWTGSARSRAPRRPPWTAGALPRRSSAIVRSSLSSCAPSMTWGAWRRPTDTTSRARPLRHAKRSSGSISPTWPRSRSRTGRPCRSGARRRLRPEQLLEVGARQEPLFAPGAAWGYSNTNYIALGLILQKVTNRSVRQLVEERISRPLGLSHTYLGAGPGFRGAWYAHGYSAAASYEGPVVDGLVDTTGLDLNWAWTGGGMVSTAPELATVYAAVLSGRLVPPAQLQQMKTTIPTGPPGVGYGLGIQQEVGPCGNRAWFHTGGVPGYTSVAAVDDTGERTGVLLIPSDVESEARHTAAQRLLDAILCGMDGKPVPPDAGSSGPS